MPGLIASAAIPVFFYDLRAKRSLKGLIIHAALVCLAGLAAFGVVMGIHFIQLYLYTGSSEEALEYLSDRAIARGGSGDTNLETPAIIFQKWLWVKVLYLSKRFFAIFPQWQEAFDRYNNFGNFHLLAFISAGLCMVLKFTRKVKAFRNPLVQGEIVLLFDLSLTMLAAMLASWSWFPALGHMSHHYHMNGIMYMVPYGLSLFILLGVLIQTLFRWLAVGMKTE